VTCTCGAVAAVRGSKQPTGDRVLDSEMVKGSIKRQELVKSDSEEGERLRQSAHPIVLPPFPYM
jgi:hypothetical protein